MNDNQNLNSMGEQIKDALADALQTGDFANLNELVSQTVTDTLTDAGKHFVKNAEKNTDRFKKTTVRQTKTQQWKPKKQQKSQQIQPSRPNTQIAPVSFREVGSVSSVLYQVFGGIGLGITGLIAVLRLPGTFFGMSTVAGWIINIIFLAFFFGMIRQGVSQKERLKRAKRYIQLCGSRMYSQIANLARDTGSSMRFVTKDLRKMLNLGMFPEGHLDKQKTCFMLNDAVHQQYLEAENNRILREKEESKAPDQKKTASESDNSPLQTDNSQETELNIMIAEGMECIRKLRELNDQIPGEVISEKLYRLENLLKDIFDSVREHPEQMHRMHTLMDYYLPTTLKLVESYEDFDKISSPGGEIIAAKAEIERTLDIINEAFSELLNNLFQDAVFDATTDAQVLQTMLAREGLTKDANFIIGGKNNEQ